MAILGLFWMIFEQLFSLVCGQIKQSQVVLFQSLYLNVPLFGTIILLGLNECDIWFVKCIVDIVY